MRCRCFRYFGSSRCDLLPPRAPARSSDEVFPQAGTARHSRCEGNRSGLGERRHRGSRLSAHPSASVSQQGCGFCQNSRRLRGGCQLFDPEPHPPVVRAFLETLVRSPRMLCSRWFAILNLAGLALSVAGGVILTYSLTVKPSHYRLVKTREGTVAICLDGKLVQAGFGGPLVATDDPCPDMETTGPVLQVVANRERLSKWGFQ